MFKTLGTLFLLKPSSELPKEELEFYKELSIKSFIFFKEHFVEDFFYQKKLEETLKELWFLAVDQEGGRVCRIPEDLDSPLEIAQKFLKKEKKLIYSWAEKIALSLKNYNLNLNLAPCVDLGEEEAPEFLRGRTFGKEPDLVIRLASIFIKVHQKYKLFTCLKHFPGLGKVKVDPHEELPVIYHIENEDLKPFKKLNFEVFFIMTTHLIIFSIDEKPVTFSERGIEFLKKVLDYKGAIVTDDLNMGGLKYWELPERILLSLVSGHNLLTFCGSWKELLLALEDLKSEVEKSKVLKERIKESVFILEKILFQRLKN